MPPDSPENKHSPLLGALDNRLTVMETRFEESNKTLFAGINELKGAIKELVSGIGGAQEQSIKSREELIRLEGQIDVLRTKMETTKDAQVEFEKAAAKREADTAVKIATLETKVWRISMAVAIIITAVNIGGNKLLSLLI